MIDLQTRCVSIINQADILFRALNRAFGVKTFSPNDPPQFVDHAEKTGALYLDFVNEYRTPINTVRRRLEHLVEQIDNEGASSSDHNRFGSLAFAYSDKSMGPAFLAGGVSFGPMHRNSQYMPVVHGSDYAKLAQLEGVGHFKFVLGTVDIDLSQFVESMSGVIVEANQSIKEELTSQLTAAKVENIEDQMSGLPLDFRSMVLFQLGRTERAEPIDLVNDKRE